MEARKFGTWEKTECDECGCEFQVTRTEPREFTGPVVCESCEQYQRGHNDGVQEGIQSVQAIVHTQFSQDLIKQSVEYLDPGLSEVRLNSAEQVVKLQEEGVKQALNKLGYLSPEKVKELRELWAELTGNADDQQPFDIGISRVDYEVFDKFIGEL